MEEKSKDDDGFALADMAGGRGEFGGGNGGDGQYQAGVITAGEWRDLDHWDFWLNLRQDQDFQSALENWSMHPFDRYRFHVSDQNGQALINAELRLMNGEEVLWKGLTNNQGLAECWANVKGDEAVSDQLSYSVYLGGVSLTEGSALPYDEGTNEVTVSYEQQDPLIADLMFVVDATGSMGDELEFLKVELNDVLEKAAAEHAELDMRYGAVFYRDVDDEYLTRSQPFDQDVDALISFIRKQKADGGGDYEEAVEVALEEALLQHSWSANARARLLFLMLDAPPHHEDQIVTRMQELTAHAASRGIAIIPIAASGINRDTEFLLRFMATLSNGTYTFVTDLSGVGDDHLEPTTGEYEDEKLNDLLLRLITTYCE